MSAKSLFRFRRAVVGLGVACAMSACLQNNQADMDNTASTGAPVLNLSNPPPLSTGRSVIEGRHVYATPDEGEITLNLAAGAAGVGEFAVAEPSMLNGEAKVTFKYSKKNNLVEMKAKIKGLPYRPTFRKDFDDSTPFNKQFMEVQNAKWQFWLVGTMFGRQHEQGYYSASTFQFLGTRYDFAPLGPKPAPAPGSYFTVPIPAVQMLCSPIFEGKPNGEAEVTFRFRYDRIEDAVGSPGAIYMLTAFNGCTPDHIDAYWTNTRLPDEKFMSWDYFLQSIWNGEGISVVMSAEPDPKPPELAFRDNTFIGFNGFYPNAMPKGFVADARSGTGRIRPAPTGSYQVPFFPPSRRNLCGGGL